MHDDEQRKIFARNLCSLLQSKGKTQADLARALNLSTATVCYWCKGQKIPSPIKLTELANWLGVSKAELMGWQIPDYDPDYTDLISWLHYSDIDVYRKYNPVDVAFHDLDADYDGVEIKQEYKIVNRRTGESYTIGETEFRGRAAEAELLIYPLFMAEAQDDDFTKIFHDLPLLSKEERHLIALQV